MSMTVSWSFRRKPRINKSPRSRVASTGGGVSLALESFFNCVPREPGWMRGPFLIWLFLNERRAQQATSSVSSLCQPIMSPPFWHDIAWSFVNLAPQPSQCGVRLSVIKSYRREMASQKASQPKQVLLTTEGVTDELGVLPCSLQLAPEEGFGRCIADVIDNHRPGGPGTLIYLLP